MKALMFALTKAGVLPSDKFMRQEENIKAKKEAARRKRLEEKVALEAKKQEKFDLENQNLQEVGQVLEGTKDVKITVFLQ